ncbi:MAG: long-chain fatty acid--CoA ligase [Clostridiales bacterium]|nr:long-chain fatty acid--CoA ligase [Clostridiales bacterium]
MITDYKEILNKYADADLNKMTGEQYAELKAAELADMQSYVDAINSSTEPTVMYKKGRAVTDLKHLLESSAEIWGGKVLYHQIMPGEKTFTEFTYGQVRRDVRGLGTALIGLGLKDTHIGIIGANCYEWAESYFAVTGGTGVVVPLDKELSPEELENLVEMGDISAVICCQNKYYDIFKSIKESGKTGLKTVIGVNKENHEDAENGLYSWNLLREEGIRAFENGDRSFADARVRASDMASIIFTSGTTGVSKGVMLSHRNLCTDILIAQTYLEVTPEDIFFSVLPIHHTYECTCTMLEGAFMGASMAFCRGLKYITKDMQAVRPTFLLAVPLIYEKFYNSIQKALRKQKRDKLVNALFAVNNVTSKIGINIAKPIAGKIMEQFGGRIEMFIAGGARVDPKVLAFFRSMGIPCLQGYGLTETSPMVALNPDQWKYMRNESAGKLFQFTECKIVDKDEDGNGEICFRGPMVMMGYYKNPEATEASMENGWFHTGDIGYLDEDNYVYITGRKKNVIIAANGKNVFPEELEEKITRSPYVEECMVWADESNEDRMLRGIYVTLRPDMENVREAIGDNADDESAVLALVSSEIDRLNSQWPDWKRVKHIVIKKSEFNKTTGMKIRRFVEENKLAE